MTSCRVNQDDLSLIIPGFEEFNMTNSARSSLSQLYSLQSSIIVNDHINNEETHSFLFPGSIKKPTTTTSTSTSTTCQDLFSDLTYLHWWHESLIQGEICDNTGRTFKGELIRPPCRSYCNAVLRNSACHTFPDAVIPKGGSVLEYCNVFPNEECQSAAHLLSPNMAALYGLLIIFLLVHRLWN